jgi:predicted nucleic acid-binding protein
MPRRCFVDTNILVYAHDRGAGARHKAAKALVEQLWHDRTGVISTQVLQELYVNVRRRAANPLALDEVRPLLEDYLRWKVVVNDSQSVLRALSLEERYRMSFWDALVVDAAVRAGCEVLYSEDLSSGQVYGQTRVVNPFLP